jgi:hypothetical protein
MLSGEDILDFPETFHQVSRARRRFVREFALQISTIKTPLLRL